MDAPKRLLNVIRGRRRLCILLILLTITCTSMTYGLLEWHGHRSVRVRGKFVHLQACASSCPGLLDHSARENMSVLRAVVAFFPVDQMVPYFSQLKWCMRSLLEVSKTEPEPWRTDIILYVEDTTTPQLLSLGCSSVPRRNASEPFRCVLVQYTKIRNRRLSPNSTGYEREIKTQLGDYSYADSIVPLGEQPSAYLSYDVVIKSDLDVFFTPAFSKWVPPKCAFVVGTGRYSTNFNMVKLSRIAKLYNVYFSKTLRDVGSTWAGAPQIVTTVAKRAVIWMLHISRYEFTPSMRSFSWWKKMELWPDWHYGVLGMYASHMAVSEVTQAGLAYPLDKGGFDHQSSSPANCTEGGPLHLHTFPNQIYFSKKLFRRNWYNGSRSLPPYWNSTRCNDYAGYIAGDSLKVTNQELYSMLVLSKSAR